MKNSFNQLSKTMPSSNINLRELGRSDVVIIIIILLVAFWLGMKWSDYSHRIAYNKNLKHRIYDL